MKKIFSLLIFICATSLAARAQTYIYDGHGNIIGGSHIHTKPGSVLTIKDSVTGNTFLLDSAHIHIYAFNARGDTIWKLTPGRIIKLKCTG